MKLSFHYTLWETFLQCPGSAEKLMRPGYGSISAEIPEADIADFPQVYLIQETRMQYRGNMWQEAAPAFYTEEIRIFRGQHYRPFRIRFGAAVSRTLPTPDYLVAILEHQYAMRLEDIEDSGYRFSGQSVILDSNAREAADFFRRKCAGYLFSRGQLWEACCEPGYLVETFRIGGKKITEMRISCFHGPKFTGNLFPAWEKKAAVRCFRQQGIENRSVLRESDVCRIIPVRSEEETQRSAAQFLTKARGEALRAI